MRRINKTLKRKADPFTLLDNDLPTSQSTSHKHHAVQIGPDGSHEVHTQRFNLTSLLVKPFAFNGALTLPNHFSLGARQYVPPNLDDDIDFLDYTTSGNFEHSDFGIDSLCDVLDQGPDNAEEPEITKRKRKRIDGGWDPLRIWAAHDRESDMLEVLRLEGWGDYPRDHACFGCAELPSIYRCIDCESVELYCMDCIVGIHSQSPLHGIKKKWNGVFFERCTLKELGLRVQLGHLSNESCINPVDGGNFTVVHTNGIHEINLDYCNCETATTRNVQIIRRHWFPATSIRPQSAATIRVLKSFHLLSFEAKCSPYEYYNSLSRASDNTGIYKTKDRYEEFMRMYRKWSNLTMAKRAGVSHTAGGIEAIKPGDCALECPACPHAEKNLPLGWEDSPPEKNWLYSLFIAIDANFCLTRKHISSEAVDPSLSDGWAFFVENEPYQAHLKKHWAEPQPKSTCVNHDAVNNSDRVVKGKAITGGGTADCARHNMKRPLGFADLQKGERYLNMDYLVFSSLSRHAAQRIVLSYDICCQWYKNIWKRMSRILPKHLQLNNCVKNTVFLVPKFHLPAHVADCVTEFSFNFAKWVGMTDGEAPERGWSRTNCLATSTQEMGPGSRQDTLNDHFNDWNWKKTTGLGAYLWKKLRQAVPQARKQSIDFKQFEESLDAERVAQYQAMVEQWERDMDNSKNPYKPTVKFTTVAAVKLAFANEAAEEAKRDAAIVHANMHPTELIAQGIQLEDQQHRLRSQVALLRSKPNSTTSDQLRKCQEAGNRLYRRINAWTKVQTAYIPGLVALREADLVAATASNKNVIPERKAEDIQLYLPSALPERLVPDRFNEYEWKLREAEAYGALYDIRKQFRIKSHWYGLKVRFHRGISDNTRSNSILLEAANKITYAAAKYRSAYSRLVTLSSRSGMDKVCPENWETNLQPLADEDIRGLGDAGVNNKGEAQSKGKATISWIWKLEGAHDGPPDEEFQIAWCKSRARKMRWDEEVELLQEEMRRVLAFLTCKSEWWASHGGLIDHVADITVREGMMAYRARQAQMHLDLRDRFDSMWSEREYLLGPGFNGNRQSPDDNTVSDDIDF